MKQYISHHTITTWPFWRSILRSLEKKCAVDCLEEALGVIFPNLGATLSNLAESTGFSDASYKNEDLPVVSEAQVSQTLASSVRSSSRSYLMFLEVSGRAAVGVQRLARGSISIPLMPSRSLMRPGSKASSRGVSDISSSLSVLTLSGESTRRNRESSHFTG